MHHIPILPLPSNTKIDQLLLTRGHSKFNNFIGRLSNVIQKDEQKTKKTGRSFVWLV